MIFFRNQIEACNYLLRTSYPFMKLIYIGLLFFGLAAIASLKRLDKNQVQMYLQIDSGKLDFSTDSNLVHLVIYNGSDSAISFYESTNSWGYSNFSFEIETEDSTYIITRTDRLWWRNFPSTQEILPNQTLKLTFNLIDSLAAGNRTFLAWKGLPQRAYRNAKIRVHYHLPEMDWSLPDFAARNYSEIYDRDTTSETSYIVEFSDSTKQKATAEKVNWIYHTDLVSDFIPVKIVN